MVESTSVTSQFRAKVAEMRAWKPENPPSNRDRLELYSLHKQAVSGDAPDPTTASVSSKASIPEKAKMNAWRNKRGLSQQEAMNQYIAECDRQMKVYGVSLASATVSPPGQQTPNNTPAQRQTNTTKGGGGGATVGVGGGISSDGQGLGSGSHNGMNSNGNMGGGNHGDNSGSSGVLLTPRGLAAVPLLCAAASESRPAYLERIAKTSKVQGWWQKQEPLCADPGTSFSMPETFLILLASKAESISLLLNDMEENNSFIIPASVIQSFLWPLHNVLLAIWIALIFICTLIGSATISLKTMILGANTTRVTLDTIFSEEILPGAKTAASLCEPHQAVPVRLVGLSLMPFVSICNVCYGVVNNIGIFPGSVLYVFTLIMTWFYWLTVLPWLAFAGLTISITSGWCFALIEMAGADIQH